jgi:hypothetical protein
VDVCPACAGVRRRRVETTARTARISTASEKTGTAELAENAEKKSLCALGALCG